MATKTKNVRRQSKFSIDKYHPPSGFHRGVNGIVLLNSGVYKVIASDKNSIVTTTTEQAFKDPGMAGYGDDYFNGWVLMAQGNCMNTSALTRGQMNLVSDYHDDGTFDTDYDWLDVDDRSAANVQQGEEFLLMPMELLPDGMMKWENAITLTAAATTGTQASHEVFTVTGLCQVRLLVLCTTTLVGTTATIELGMAGDMDYLIATTTVGNGDIAATEIWCDDTAADCAVRQFTSDAMFDFVVDGEDIGYDVNTANITAGVLKFICYWKPLEHGATVIPAVGSATL